MMPVDFYPTEQFGRERLEFCVDGARVLTLVHPLPKLDGKPGQCCLAVTQLHRPILADVGRDQIEQFE